MKRVKYLTCLSGNDVVVNTGDIAIISDAEAARLADERPPMVEILEHVEEPKESALAETPAEEPSAVSEEAEPTDPKPAKPKKK